MADDSLVNQAITTLQTAGNVVAATPSIPGNVRGGNDSGRIVAVLAQANGQAITLLQQSLATPPE